MHHHIVALERIHQPLPASFSFPPGHSYTLTVHEAPDASKLRARVAPATILIVTTVKLSAEILAADVTPHLQYVAVMATGTDPVDLEACKARGIRVTNSPSANLDSVSEHALSLYFAARRRTALLDRLTRSVPSEWKAKKSLSGALRFADGSPPLTCKDEVMGIIGYGPLGKRIAGLGRALGMQVLIASRKNTQLNRVLPSTDLDHSRVPFEDVLRESTVLVLSLPRTPETVNLLSTPEFETMSPYAVLVNVARGGIVDEAAVLKALQDGQIAGYGTDVFEKEPAEGPDECVLFSEEAKALNITVSPHLAWFAGTTLTNLSRILKETVEAWVAGEPINVIV
ncbi:glycerate dehydrogenase [Lophiostoma macrostomum CBS 122681]|uniref:Glycerate dehydrogenase n=1 Tax=Lophiostoma macrostomum CBS 122681 TaxID=1314788 RepID=A0A6A6SYP1_9PLEO|nr:glycerate dehydrogenase [Lophiostoma macrostomum CBS 122681]